MTRVLICASSAVTREGLASLLRGGAFEVVAAVESLPEIDEKVRSADPDAIVVAIDPRDEEAFTEWLGNLAGDGPPESAETRQWQPVRTGSASAMPPIVVLADRLEVIPFSLALEAGVRAFLPRDADSDEISSAIQAAAAGLVAARPGTLNDLQRPRALRAPAEMMGEAVRAQYTEALTPREIEVLRMLAEGLANKEIARRLKISEHTVKFHIGSILGKLSASSRTEAVTIGIRLGLITV